MRIGLLGPMAVADGQEHELALGGPKQRAVLAILVVHANQDVASDRIVELLWGERAPRSAAKSLQVHVSRLRRALHEDAGEAAARLVTTSAGYRLRVAPGELDAERFERLVGEAEQLAGAERWQAAAERLRQALQLWRGDPLSDFAYESFAQPEIARLQELHVVAMEQRVAVELALGHEAAVVGDLEQLIRNHPYRERLHGQLMLALYRTGRQADALAAFRDARARLSDELGIDPSAELARLHEAILRQDPSLDRVSTPADGGENPTNLAAQTRPLIGRRDECAEVIELLGTRGAGVITLTGIGGIGKTRLATEVAAEMLDDLPGGAFLVSLAGIADPQSILPMIAEAIGLTGGGGERLDAVLATRFGRQPTLLILDNFEQLVQSAAVVGELATRAKELRILVTSQVPLRIGAEVVVQLGPLGSDDAAALFIERVRARERAFAVGASEDAIIASICERVDGMPLAIELAAARARGLGLRELDRQLERPLGLLTRGDRDLPERQRSLRAAVEFSQALLSADDDELFVALGSCAGPVPLGMVAALAGPAAAATVTLDRLEALLESSFIRRREDPRFGLRFQMPQALRNYAAERLGKSGGEGDVRLRHARHVAGLAWDSRLWKWGATEEQQDALRAVDAEIRPAVAWARENDPLLHVSLCAGLSGYWVYCGVVPEVAAELRRALESGAGLPAERARCLTIQAQCLRLGGAQDQALELAGLAYAEWQKVDDELERALGYGDLNWVYRWVGQFNDALAVCEEALPILRQSRNRNLTVRGLVTLAHALADLGEVDRTEQVLDEADEVAGKAQASIINVRGDCAMYRGDHTRAAVLYTESLRWSSENDEAHQALMDLRCLGICLGRGGYAEAALEVIELVRLHEEGTGRAGNISSAVRLLQESRAHALELAGPTAEQEAIARARSVSVSLRIQRVLDLSARALAADAADIPTQAPIR